jgi:hypothetical protein
MHVEKSCRPMVEGNGKMPTKADSSRRELTLVVAR